MVINDITEINGYEYTIYDGGTVKACGYSQDNMASRNGMSKDIGGQSKLSTDDRGHLIGAQHNGPASDINLSAQNRSLNRGAYKAVENAEMRITRDAENPGNVFMEKTAFTINANELGSRPEAYIVNDTITYESGAQQHVNLSFANLSPAEQQMYGEIASQYDIEAENPGDTLRENEVDYSSLMETTESSLPSIRDEFDGAWTEVHYECDTAGIESGTAAADAEAGVEAGAEVDSDMDMDD